MATWIRVRFNPLNGNPKSQSFQITVSGWPSKIANLVGAFKWLSASKHLVMKGKVGGSK